MLEVCCFLQKYRWVGGQASSIRWEENDYESWGQKVQCEMLVYFEVARDIGIIYGMSLTAWRNMRCLTRGWSSKLMSIFIPVELRSFLEVAGKPSTWFGSCGPACSQS